MRDWETTELPDELGDMESQLRENRHQATPLELDELKRRALTQAARAERAPRRGFGLRRRAVTLLLVAGLSASAASAGVIASSRSYKSGPSASLSQYEGQVLPERVAPASAKLAAPSGCLRGTFTARVTGKNIAKVVFSLRGRVIKTVKAKAAQTNGRFTVRIDADKLPVGVTRLTARVTFIAATKKRPRTLRIGVVRCARQVVRPQFTG